METDCKPNCDSILKKAKWLIIAAYVWNICIFLHNYLGINIWIEDYTDWIHYVKYIKPILDLSTYPLLLVAYLYLRKHPNKVFKWSANILLSTLIFQIAVDVFICYLPFTLFEKELIASNTLTIIVILFTYFYFLAYRILLKDPVIKKMYIPSIYLLCLGTIIIRYINIPYAVLYTITSGSPLQHIMTSFSQANNIAGLLLGLTAFILIIFGWKQLLSTPSQIPTTTSDTPISLKPTKVEYGYLVSCGVLIALLFIYFNSVSLDIFTK